ncbi:MAG: hypothetical protein E7280_05800 [Lachnospiraceae bacterium]|nr:hypothetical protein [Lachnospiraceae bacterium]
MSTEYVDQLTEIAKTKVNGTYVLMYLDNDLIKTSISEDENSVPDSYIKRLSSEINISDFLYNIENIVIDSPEYPDERPIVRQLNVTPVKQEGPTCWAATCACIINYYENTSKTAQELARSIYGKDWKRESIWTEYVQLYHRNGLYPTLNGVLQFSKVKENINNGNPMHLLLEGHAVALIGYKEWKKSLNNNGDNKVLILMNPSMGGIRTVTLNKSGNFYYSGKDAWKYTGVF